MCTSETTTTGLRRHKAARDHSWTLLITQSSGGACFGRVNKKSDPVNNKSGIVPNGWEMHPKLRDTITMSHGTDLDMRP